VGKLFVYIADNDDVFPSHVQTVLGYKDPALAVCIFPANDTSPQNLTSSDPHHTNSAAMAQPYLAIKRSTYHSWVPQSNNIHNEFIRHLIRASKGSVRHKNAVTTFDKAVTQAQKDLFMSALTQVAQYYAKVCQNWRHDHKLIFFFFSGPTHQP